MAAIVSLIQSAGLLQSPRFFSCGHWYGDEGDARERVILKFEVYNPHSTNVHFGFWSDGVIDLTAHPTKHGVPWWAQPILVGSYPIPTSELLVTIEGSLEVIAATLRLYSISQPMDDYEPLLQAWQLLNPKLLDTAESLKELQAENAYVPKAPVPWWKFWHNLGSS